MVDYLPRSAWGARAPKAGPGPLTVSRVEGEVIHWPGTSSKTPITSQAAVASALRGWQAYHMDTKGWSDIAYQVAVDQAGRAWTLRGLRTQSGANGNNELNETYGAILLVLIAGEQPSAAMKATTREVIRDFREMYPNGDAIKPHSAVRPDGTDCPGTPARAAIARGDFTPLEDDMPLNQADKTWITGEIQRYAAFGALHTDQIEATTAGDVDIVLKDDFAKLGTGIQALLTGQAAQTAAITKLTAAVTALTASLPKA